MMGVGKEVSDGCLNDASWLARLTIDPQQMCLWELPQFLQHIKSKKAKPWDHKHVLLKTQRRVQRHSMPPSLPSSFSVSTHPSLHFLPAPPVEF